jgi:Polyketide cyclase / dehydrase and lipid transport
MPIDVPRERAFAFLADLANRPSFMSRFLSDFRLMRLDSTGVGAAARFKVRERGLWMETEIEELEPPYRILERGRGSRLGRMPVHTAWEVTEAGIGSCEVKVVHWTEPSQLFDKLAEKAPGMRAYYGRALEGALAQLKGLLEAEVPTERAAVAGGDRVPGAG